MRKLVWALCLAPVTALAGPFDGYYRPSGPWGDGWDCRSLGSDRGAVGVMGDRIVFVEGGCQLTNPVQVNGMGAILYDGRCAQEGTEYSERILLMRRNDPFGLYVITDGHVAEWSVCETE